MRCKICGSGRLSKIGHTLALRPKQRWFCHNCKRTFSTQMIKTKVIIKKTFYR